MPLFGKLGDICGHRRLYLLGFAGFTVGAALTALAWSGPALIAIRTLGSLPGRGDRPRVDGADHAGVPRRGPGQGDGVVVAGRGGRAGDRPGRGRSRSSMPSGGGAIFVAQVPLSRVRTRSWRSSSCARRPGASTSRSTSPARRRSPRRPIAALLALTFGARIGYGHPLTIGLAVLAPLDALVRSCGSNVGRRGRCCRCGSSRRGTSRASLVSQFCAELRVHGRVHHHAVARAEPVRVHRGGDVVGDGVPAAHLQPHGTGFGLPRGARR